MYTTICPHLKGINGACLFGSLFINMHVAVYNILKRCYEFIVIIEVYLDRIGYGVVYLDRTGYVVVYLDRNGYVVVYLDRIGYGVVYLDRIGYGVWPRSALSYICLQHLCPSKPWLETS